MLRRACLRAPPAWRTLASPARLPLSSPLFRVFISTSSESSSRVTPRTPAAEASAGTSPRARTPVQVAAATAAATAAAVSGVGSGSVTSSASASPSVLAAGATSPGTSGGVVRRDAARENAGKIIRTLLAYVWPAAAPAVRARVVAALTLLVGAKAVGLASPFLFKEVCDALSSSRGLVDAAVAAGGGTAGGAALALPLAALLGCKFS